MRIGCYHRSSFEMARRRGKILELDERFRKIWVFGKSPAADSSHTLLFVILLVLTSAILLIPFVRSLRRSGIVEHYSSAALPSLPKWRDVEVQLVDASGIAILARTLPLGTVCVIEYRYRRPDAPNVPDWSEVRVLDDYCEEPPAPLMLGVWNPLFKDQVIILGWEPRKGHQPTEWHLGHLYREYRLVKRAAL